MSSDCNSLCGPCRLRSGGSDVLDIVLCIDEKQGCKRWNESIRPSARSQEGVDDTSPNTYVTVRSHYWPALTSTGYAVPCCGPTRTADDLLALLEQVAVEYRYAKRIIVLWGNLNIHYDGKSNRWTAFNERHGGKFEFRYTPLHASWINQVEVFFSILHRRCLKHGSFTAVEDLRDKVLAFINQWNEKDGHPFDWCFRGYPIQSAEKEVA